MATIVDIYCRTATNDPEARTKLEQQEATCRAYCHECGLSVAKVHYEIASGSTYRDRELLSLMRNRYRTSIIQGVVVTTLDRLSRSHAHLVILLQEMATHDAAFYCVHDTVADTTGRFVSLLLDFVTEVEREKLIDASLTRDQ